MTRMAWSKDPAIERVQTTCAFLPVNHDVNWPDFHPDVATRPDSGTDWQGLLERQHFADWSQSSLYRQATTGVSATKRTHLDTFEFLLSAMLTACLCRKRTSEQLLQIERGKERKTDWPATSFFPR